MSAVDHPDHYNRGGAEVISLVEYLGFCAGNIIKYILRAPYKGSAKEDLEKAKWYMARLHKGPIDPSRQLLISWVEVLRIAGKFNSSAVDAVIDYCMNASPDAYRRVLREINKLEKNMSDTNDAKKDAIELNDKERQPCEVWTRVMGYHRPTSSFNIGKVGEFNDRVFFTESKCCGDK